MCNPKAGRQFSLLDGKVPNTNTNMELNVKTITLVENWPIRGRCFTNRGQSL